ncbi:MFS transporter [Schaalia canis]|uniref:MFS transporter n=1 Tax=Schaalia canis TaxID=100469 RepID=A0A3P1SFY3_9ACTO|nr:MFS transporter [Schaalia canis]RRC95887.1 MFS transporter [Schaalia canis]
MSRTFASLAHHNFRLWFAGNILASSAMWMQRVAQDWLVLTVLTDKSGAQAGIVIALQFLPMMILSPWTGVVADRVDRRTLVQITQSISALLGLGLGTLILSGSIQLWHVHLFALVGGISSSFDAPARQAFVAEMVPPHSVANAVALSSMSFTSARLIGPVGAGLIIDRAGVGWVFIINALIFVVPVLLIALMRVHELNPRDHAPRAKGQIREGLRYIADRPDLIIVFVLMSVVASLGLNFQLTSAMMATTVFNKGAGEFGLLATFSAIGGVTGALIAARIGAARLRFLIPASAAFGVMLIVVSLSPNYLAYALLVIPLGTASMLTMTSANSVLQTRTPDRIRGRVMSLYTIIFLGTTPIGAPFVGWVGETYGARWALAVGGIASLSIAVIMGVALLAQQRRIRDGKTTS